MSIIEQAATAALPSTNVAGQAPASERKPWQGTVVGLDRLGRPVVRRGWKTIEQIAAEHLAMFPEPVRGGPLGVDIIREDRDSR